MPESIGSPEPQEIQKLSQPVDVYIFRHGHEDKSTGELSPEGVEGTSQATKEVAERALEAQEPTAFFILASPTRRKGMGQRAMHSGRIAEGAINDVIAERGLTPDQASVHLFGERDEATKPHGSLSAPGFSFNPEIEDYIVNQLEDDWTRAEEDFLNMDNDDLETLIQRSGEDNAADVGSRAKHLFKVVNRYSKLYAKNLPDVKQVYIFETHGDTQRAVVQHELGVGDAAREHIFHNSEYIHASMQGNNVTTEFEGQSYQSEL